MNILLINPRIPDTYWSFSHALKFVHKKAANPPLGLLTIAAMLPEGWNRKVTDLNTGPLHERDLRWADYAFISAMSIQKDSVLEVVARCRQSGVKIVAGGPLFTGDPEPFLHIDHLILNEAEITLPPFLRDLEKGTPEKLYRTDRFADIRTTPPPDYSLVRVSDYAQLSIQFSRGWKEGQDQNPGPGDQGTGFHLSFRIQGQSVFCGR
jgi:radical SAM superfamily enzyme YgiQ (UPF0313 family)